MILAGYGSILIALIGLGWVTVHEMRTLKEIPHNLYMHPYDVSNAAAELKDALFQVRDRIVYLVMQPNNADNLARVAAEVKSLSRTARRDVTIISSNFQGDMSKVRELESRLDQWNVDSARIIEAIDRQDNRAAMELIKSTASTNFSEIVPLVEYVRSDSRNQAKYYVDLADQRSELITTRTTGLMALLFLFFTGTGMVVYLRVKQLQNELSEQARIDYLTGIPNRRHFLELVERELARCHRYKEPFAIAIADLDLFKSINDNHGHQVGDQVLKEFCKVCQATLRKPDIFGRIGGEEFAILLPRTSLAEAREVIERVRRNTEQAAIPSDDDMGQMNFTASFGLVSSLDPRLDIYTLIRSADQALYEAKRTGRNKVCDHTA